ncbi:hypothetical protein J1614_002031 [Plenodomus biglobosus]|nr:hypothetical protein J1614_002031 [Plenodomus biglobosus]
MHHALQCQQAGNICKQFSIGTSIQIGCNMHHSDISPPVLQCCIVKQVEKANYGPSDQNTTPNATTDREQRPDSETIITVVSGVQHIHNVSEPLQSSTETLKVERPLPPSDNSESHDGLLYRRVG